MSAIQTRSSPHAAARGFTLIELLVVIGIIVLLVALLLPALGAANARARAVATQSQLSDISKACEMYFNDFGAYPGLLSEQQLAEPGCPISGAQALAISLDYRWLPNTPPPQPSWRLVLPQGGATWTFFSVEPDLASRPQKHSYIGTSTDYDAYLPANPKQFSTQKQRLQFQDPNPSATFQTQTNIEAIPCFVDSAFGSSAMPILYYRSTSAIPPGNTGGPNQATEARLGADGAGITASFYSEVNWSLRNNAANDAASASVPVALSGVNNDAFDQTVCNQASPGTNNFSVPKGQFVLLSAGVDRLYGTSDDIIVSGGH